MKKDNSKKQGKGKVFIKVLLCIILSLSLAFILGCRFLENKLSLANRGSSESTEQNDTLQPDSENKPDSFPASHSTASKENNSPVFEQEKPVSDKKVKNILLIGVDNDYLPGMNDRGNADGIVILTVNNKTDRIVMTSILRDTLLTVPGHSEDKATMVYHNHGLETLIAAIEQTFRIDINNYVLVNYLNVINIIDAVGGVPIDIKPEELHEMEYKLNNINSLVGDPYGTDILTMDDVGLKNRNGKQAATYMRLRETGGDDFGRTGRVRTVLNEIKNKVTDMGLKELNDFADVAMSNINTDMSTKDMLSLIAKAPSYLKYEFKSYHIPLDDSYTTDGSYLFIDVDRNRQAIHEMIFGSAD